MTRHGVRSICAAASLYLLLSSAPPSHADDEHPIAPASEAAWPIQRIARPPVLLKGNWLVGAGLWSDGDFDPSVGDLAVGVGVWRRIELDVVYSAPVVDFAPDEGWLSLRAGFFERFGSVDWVNRFAYMQEVSGDDPSEDASLTSELRWYLNDQLVVRPALSFTGSVALPISFGFQATPNAFLDLRTWLVEYDDPDDELRVVLRDYLPVVLRLYVAPTNSFELVAGIHADVLNGPRRNVGFLLGATYYGGL